MEPTNTRLPVTLFATTVVYTRLLFPPARDSNLQIDRPPNYVCPDLVMPTLGTLASIFIFIFVFISFQFSFQLGCDKAARQFPSLIYVIVEHIRNVRLKGFAGKIMTGIGPLYMLGRKAWIKWHSHVLYKVAKIHT